MLRSLLPLLVCTATLSSLTSTGCCATPVPVTALPPPRVTVLPRPQACHPSQLSLTPGPGPTIEATVIVPGEWERVSVPLDRVLVVDESFVVRADWIRRMVAWASKVGAYRRAVDACLASLGAEPVETPKRAFDPPPPDECDDAGGRAGDGSCMDNSPGSP